MTSTFVSEIYPSIQGEGPYTGERQIFLRLAGCPLRCNYCDTPGSLTVNGHERMSVEQVEQEIDRIYNQTGIKTISITGGEPLVHVSFLKELLPVLKDNQYRLYLETAGVHVDALKILETYLDVVSMDMKLPSATGQDHWEEHEKFLRTANVKAFVKVVLEKKSQLVEIEKLIEVLQQVARPPTLIFQPATAQAPDIEPASPDFIARAYKMAKEKLGEVFVMPQQHKIWGMR